jgi:hypothetical protein
LLVLFVRGSEWLQAERRMASQIAAHDSWAQTEDRAARTAKARAAFDQKFLDLAGGDPVKAAHLRKAHFARLQLQALRARRKAREFRQLAKAAAAEAEAEATEAELRALGGEEE